MVKLIKGFKSEFRRGLSKAAAGYLSAGLDLFHTGVYQPALGNLAISAELMLKCFIVSKDFSLVFKSLPLELRAGLASKSSSINWRHHYYDLKDSVTKTIELQECISCFNVFFRNHNLGSYFKDLTAIRNMAVHSFVPEYYRYHSDRIAFMALRILMLVNEERKLSKLITYTPNKKDVDFIFKYNKDMSDSVHAKIETAKREAKKPIRALNIAVDTWDKCVNKCPVCKCDAVFDGETVLDSYEDLDLVPEQWLVFHAESMKCCFCKLELDNEEMQIAGVKTSFLREGLENYMEMKGYIKNRAMDYPQPEI